MPRRKTTEEFIRDAKSKHGDKYDYSEVEYVNRRTKVRIICPEHGPFFQIPNTHINKGCGCPKCGGTVKKDTDEFIENAKEIHGEKYDYSQAHYIDNRTKVKIICPVHGPFLQSPDVHIDQGSDCPKCAREQQANLKRKSKEEFLADAQKVHGDKYDYSQIYDRWY